MKKANLIIFSFLLVLLVMFSFIPAAAQKNDLAPLADNASKEEAQKWISRAIGKYVAFKTLTGRFEAADVKFSGCELSYTLVKHYEGTATVYNQPVQMALNDKKPVKLALADFDPDKMSLQDDEKISEVKIIILMKNGSDQPATNAAGEKNYATLVVQSKAAEPIKNAVAHMLKLCQVK